jgi:predicted RNase H-like nuclease (RuvC/YqgF family)
VERGTWTNERLDDLSAKVDQGFDRVDRRFEQVDRRFEQVDRRFDETNRRIDALGSDLRSELDALRMTILRVGGGMMIGLLGVIAAVLARGA